MQSQNMIEIGDLAFLYNDDSHCPSMNGCLFITDRKYADGYLSCRDNDRTSQNFNNKILQPSVGDGDKMHELSSYSSKAETQRSADIQKTC